jgi:hypothetical protein
MRTTSHSHSLQLATITKQNSKSKRKSRRYKVKNANPAGVTTVGLESGDINDASTKIKQRMSRKSRESEKFKGVPLHRLSEVRAAPPGTQIE